MMSASTFKDKPVTFKDKPVTFVVRDAAKESLSPLFRRTFGTPSRTSRTMFNVMLLIGVLLLVHGIIHQPGAEDDVTAQGRDMLPDLSVLRPGYTGPVFFHILAYPKTGSSFIGKIMELYPDAFYFHEPLQLLYPALYGVKAESNGLPPYSVLLGADGKPRKMMPVEKGLSLWTLDRIFHCKLSELPTAMLISSFWGSEAARNMPATSLSYTQCLEQEGIRMAEGYEAFQECYKHIKHICPSTFNPNSPQVDRCQKVLFTNGTFTTNDSNALWVDARKHDRKLFQDRRKFTSYWNCLSKVEAAAKKCAEMNLDQVCSRKKFRIVKTVQARMQIVDDLLDSLPSYRVVQVFRDPRGVIYSVKQAASPRYLPPAMSKNISANSARSISHAYCDLLYQDKIHRHKLQHMYFDRVIGLLYDKFLTNVTANMEWLSEHLHLDGKQLQRSLDYAAHSTDMLSRSKWTSLPPADVVDIQGECNKVMMNMQLCLSGMRCNVYSMED